MPLNPMKMQYIDLVKAIPANKIENSFVNHVGDKKISNFPLQK